MLTLKNVVVINDEAHHCYRERAAGWTKTFSGATTTTRRNQNNEAARLWISGIEALKRKVNGVCTVYDLSATPFFLRGQATTRARSFRGWYPTSR